MSRKINEKHRPSDRKKEHKARRALKNNTLIISRLKICRHSRNSTYITFAIVHIHRIEIYMEKLKIGFPKNAPIVRFYCILLLSLVASSAKMSRLKIFSMRERSRSFVCMRGVTKSVIASSIILLSLSRRRVFSENLRNSFHAFFSLFTTMFPSVTRSR